MLAGTTEQTGRNVEALVRDSTAVNCTRVHHESADVRERRLLRVASSVTHFSRWLGFVRYGGVLWWRGRSALCRVCAVPGDRRHGRLQYLRRWVGAGQGFQPRRTLQSDGESFWAGCSYVSGARVERLGHKYRS
jgi:hypothetical protein